MTYQQKFDQLRNAFAESSDKYSRADKALSEVKGFGDAALIEILPMQRENLKSVVIIITIS